MATTTKATRKPKPDAAQCKLARIVSGKSAAEVRAMTPAQRAAIIRADRERTLNEFAPSLESATSDLLKVLQAVGLEFISKYYPDATYAGLSSFGPGDVLTKYHAQLPIPLPAEAIRDAAAGA